MTEWETDHEGTAKGPGPSSRTKVHDFSRTPSAKSKRASRRSMTPPARGPSPSIMATERADKRSSRDITKDESISILDPRRFTPTLHANLVSEILALRRDQEEKTKQIESLESTLQNIKTEHEQLQENFTTTSKEGRSLKRQLSLLEGGTSSALGELVRERDEAVESAAESKKRLDAAQKKIRIQEDDSHRVHDHWAQEKDDWEEERRKYERRLHVAESRLKVVLDEMAAYQAAQFNGDRNGSLHRETDAEDSDRENDTGSVRTMSITNSIRHSLLSGPVLHPGHSLADELSFDDDDQTDVDGRESVLSIRTSPKQHRRAFSRDSVASRLHRRNQSVESLKRRGSMIRGKLFMNLSVLEALEGEDEESEERQLPVVASYMDAAVQYSPPPSPGTPRMQSTTSDLALSHVKAIDLEDQSSANTEVDANEGRKRAQTGQSLAIEPPSPDNKMVSVAAQTVEMPLTPPKTPQLSYLDSPTAEAIVVTLVTASTQTEHEEYAPPAVHDHSTSLLRLTPSPPPLQVPTINIEPPTSRPTTPREPRLPQHFKHFGCQVNLRVSLGTVDMSVQTEGIQVDKRIALLPAHLQPSTISSRPTSPNLSMSGQLAEASPKPENLPPRNPRRLTNSGDMTELPSSPLTPRDDEVLDDYSTLADDHMLSASKGGAKHANRLSNIFTSFDTASSDEDDDFGDFDASDSEYRTALSAPRPISTGRSMKRGSFGAYAAHEQPTSRSAARRSIKPINTDLYNSSWFFDKENQRKGHVKRLSRTYQKPPAPAPPSSSSNQNSTMRRAAIIQNGIASIQSRPQSPSISEGQIPPYPIPDRASSRRGTSTPSDGLESPTRGDMWPRRGSSRSSYRPHSVRKVRSAAAIPRTYRHRRHGSKSSLPLSPSTEAPESPGLPPLPCNDITTPRSGLDPSTMGISGHRGHQHQMSANTDKTNTTIPATDPGAPNSRGVVDAIAQTMVGEWMLKYVRRRKSFSVPESNNRDDSSNDRHKRWVWLAPYERSILWSSKQPSSGSALLGKTGRKLIIQSVLDVKDDNPAPKVMPLVFNRSILILTPQRALKFTAANAERHYLWLSALSFLAHSSQAVPDIISAPSSNNIKQQNLLEFDSAPQPKIKRGGIRDSIRLAKGKPGLSKFPISSVPSIPSIPSTAISGIHSRGQSREAAEPPFIPRFSERAAQAMSAHGRKRSNTGGHVAPPLSFRGFSGPAGGSSSGPYQSGHSTEIASVETTMSTDVYHSQSQASPNTTWNMSRTGSQRTSEASSRPSNFFDAIGTVRMEAFISPLAQSRRSELADDGNADLRKTARRRSKEIRRRNSRGRYRDGTGYRIGRGCDPASRDGSQADEDFFGRDDPFKGF